MYLVLNEISVKFDGERQTKEKLIFYVEEGSYSYININCFLDTNLLFIWTSESAAEPNLMVGGYLHYFFTLFISMSYPHTLIYSLSLSTVYIFEP